MHCTNTHYNMINLREAALLLEGLLPPFISDTNLELRPMYEY